VSVLAGSGNIGSKDGAGTKASFWAPTGIAIDQRNGNVFVSEWYGNVIRMIFWQGSTSELIATEEAAIRKKEISLQALGNLPLHIWLDIIPQCDLVSLSKLSQVCFAFYVPAKKSMGGRVVTLAGEGEEGGDDGQGNLAGFARPCGLSFNERDECLYIADHGNNKIRQLDIKTGIVSTIAGTKQSGFLDGDGSHAQFNGPLGVTFVEQTRSVLVADYSNNRIRHIRLAEPGGQFFVETLAGNGFAADKDGLALECLLDHPYATCIDYDNNVCYFTDAMNHKIKKLTRI